MIESKKLSVHDLRVESMLESRSNSIKSGLEMSSIDDSLGRIDSIQFLKY